MKTKTPKTVPKPRNPVLRAMLQTTRNAVHGKTGKQQRNAGRAALRRSLKDEGFSVQRTGVC